MDKCDWTQPRICALAASEMLKWVITASLVPSERGQRESNSSCINEINSSGNSTDRKILVTLWMRRLGSVFELEYRGVEKLLFRLARGLSSEIV